MSESKHSRLKQEAMDAADKLHSDTSVSKEKTKESLEELVEHIQVLIETLS